MGCFGRTIAGLLATFFCYGMAEAYFGFGIPKLYSQKSSIRQVASTEPMGANEFVYVQGKKFRGNPRGGGVHSGK